MQAKGHLEICWHTTLTSESFKFDPMNPIKGIVRFYRITKLLFYFLLKSALNTLKCM